MQNRVLIVFRRGRESNSMAIYLLIGYGIFTDIILIKYSCTELCGRQICLDLECIIILHVSELRLGFPRDLMCSEQIISEMLQRFPIGDDVYLLHCGTLRRDVSLFVQDDKSRVSHEAVILLISNAKSKKPKIYKKNERNML